MVWTWLSSLPFRRTAPIPETEETQQTEPPSLTTLPTELFLLVSEQLSLADALCLALTCKRMCNIADISSSAKRLDTDARDTLLCRLERDTIGLTYCFEAQKLLPDDFPTHKEDLSEDYVHDHDATDPDLERVPWFQNGMFMLDYCTARVVTNHQLLGPLHGVPASYLATTDNYRIPWGRGVCNSEVWAAKMIHGELFLSCIRTIFHKKANAGALQHYCDTETIEVCPHTMFGSYQKFRLPWNLIGNTERHYVGWCWKCETDWEVNIGWADTKRGWTVTITTYHGLGACRSPQDQKWQAMSDNPKAKAHREVPGGAVKELWEQHKS